MALPTLEALAGASLVTLQDMELKALNESANLSQGMRQDLERCVEALAVAMVARRLIEAKRAAAPRQLEMPLSERPRV